MTWEDCLSDEMGDGVRAAIAAAPAAGPRLLDLLRGFLDALRCDGRHAPLTTARRALTSIQVVIGQQRFDVLGGTSDPRCAQAFFDVLEAVADASADHERPPPTLLELLRQLALSIAYVHTDGAIPAFVDVASCPPDVVCRAIERAELCFGGPKPRDRGERPIVAPAPGAERVRHAKFGVGLLIERRGDKVVVVFPSGRRTLLARVVEPA